MNSSAASIRYIPSFVKPFVIKMIKITISQYTLMIQLITAEIKQKSTGTIKAHQPHSKHPLVSMFTASLGVNLRVAFFNMHFYI